MSIAGRLVLLAQAPGDAASPVDPSAWEQFGPFAICFVILSAAIAWLLRERGLVQAAHEAEVAELRRELEHEREANREIADRLVASAERTAPILERAARALEAAGASYR